MSPSITKTAVTDCSEHLARLRDTPKRIMECSHIKEKLIVLTNKVVNQKVLQYGEEGEKSRAQKTTTTDCLECLARLRDTPEQIREHPSYRQHHTLHLDHSAAHLQYVTRC